MEGGRETWARSGTDSQRIVRESPLSAETATHTFSDRATDRAETGAGPLRGVVGRLAKTSLPAYRRSA